MFSYLLELFNTQGWPPRWLCGTWSQALGWTHIVSDLLIFTMLMAIPLWMGLLIHRRKGNIPFKGAITLFAILTVFCGFTHLSEALAFWWPGYRLMGLLKFLTAMLSVATFFVMIPIFPQALSLKNPEELAREVEKRIKTEAQLTTVVERHKKLTEFNLATLSLRDSSYLNILKQFAKLVADLCCTPYLQILIWNPEENALIPTVLQGWPEDFEMKPFTLASRYQIAQTFRSGKALYTPDFNQDLQFQRPDFLETIAVQSGITVAIPGHHETLGVLACYQNELNRLCEADIDFLQSAAAMLGNIIERHNAEEEAAQLNEELISQFVGTFEQVAVGLGHIDLLGNWLKVNTKLCQITRCTREELMNTRLSTMIDTEVWDSLASKLQTLQNNPTEALIQETLLRCPCNDNQTHWVKLTISTLQPLQNRPPNFVVVMEDITARQQSEDALRRSERRTRKIIDSNVIGIMFADLNGKIIDGNQAFFDLLGYEREEALAEGLYWTDMTPQEYRQQDQCNVETLRKSELIKSFEKQFVRRNGSRVDIMISAALLEPGGNEAVCYVLDITQRKQAEIMMHRLLDRERLLRRIVEIINKSFDLTEILQYVAKEVGEFFKVDRCLIIEYKQHQFPLQTKIIAQYVSGPAIESVDEAHYPLWMFQRLRSEMSYTGESLYVGYSHFEEFPADLKPFADHYNIQALMAFEIHYRGDNYGRMSLHQCLVPREWSLEDVIILEGIAVHLGVAFYQFDLYQQEQRARKSAEAANQKKSQFLANMSHELRTPLNAVIGYSQMLEQGLAGRSMTDREKQYLKNVIVSGQHLLTMVNDILDLSKVESGKITLLSTWVDLPPLINDIKGVFEDLAATKHVALKFEIHPEVEGIQADPDRLRQIFLNLISNAIKFNRENGQVIVRVYPSQDNQWLVCQVEDTGIGIPKDKLQNLFTEFFQVDPSFSRHYEGTGLGLALSKKLIELHGGSIEVESTEGKGSVFTFKLPIHSPLPTAFEAITSTG